LLYICWCFICLGCVQHFPEILPTNHETTASSDVSDSQEPDNAEMPQDIISGSVPESIYADDISGESCSDNGISPVERKLPVSPITEEKPATKVNAQAVIDEAIDYCEVSQELWQKGELENALEALDQAYALLLKLDHYDNPKLIQQKEDLRFMISKRILEIYASRNIVVNGNHKAIPLEMNRHVQAEIKHFTTDEKAFFIEAYKRSGLYRPYMIKALEEAGLPVELSWLPLIESGFKAQAMSRARALGLWQFIPSTGYKFGLKRNTYIDERLDPIKATTAATAYLKELHQIFGDWSTALAAYNCGEGRVLRLIRTQNINYLDNFWDLYELLPLETSRYVPRYLAALYIINNPRKYGLDKVEVMAPMNYETVTLCRQVHLRDIAKQIDAEESDLKLLNPELRYGILPNETYTLRIPPDKGEGLLARLDTIPISHPPQQAYIKHRVRSGESLSVIADRYRTSINSIMRANNIRKRNFIVAGTVLKIPRRGAVIQTVQPSTTMNSSREVITYKVRSGDSLWILAKRYDTTTKNIIAINQLTSNNLYIGQALKIPSRIQKSEPGENDEYKTYLVVRGDSPYTIAKKHNMSLEKLLRINNLTPRNMIYPGQNLFVE